MDLGTAPLFDLTAPAAEAGEHTVSRSDELLAEIRDDQNVIAEREIATLRRDCRVGRPCTWSTTKPTRRR